MSMDCLTLNASNEIAVLDKGFVKLIDCMPRLIPEGQTADYAIVQAARVSYGDGVKNRSDDESLIRYLMRHAHTSPTEQVEFKFCMKLPIFCARQFVRTRTANLNEISGRYSEVKDDYYIPVVENIRSQSSTNKQGGEIPINEQDAESVRGDITAHSKRSYELYKLLLQDGVSREQARMVLPLNYYTEWYWKIDLHNLLHTLSLRCDSHAQWETRQYAEAILSLIKNIVPITIQAWQDYHPMRGAMKLTALEVREIQNAEMPTIDHTKVSPNKREQLEWLEKLKVLS